jgi:hypothetical protein
MRRVLASVSGAGAAPQIGTDETQIATAVGGEWWGRSLPGGEDESAGWPP